jgi:hypothetical protein
VGLQIRGIELIWLNPYLRARVNLRARHFFETFDVKAGFARTFFSICSEAYNAFLTKPLEDCFESAGVGSRAKAADEAGS